MSFLNSYHRFYCATGNNWAFGDLPILSTEERASVTQYPAGNAFTGYPDTVLFPKKDGRIFFLESFLGKSTFLQEGR